MTRESQHRNCGCILGILGLVILVIVAISVAAFIYEQNPPPVIAQPTWDSPQTQALAQRACLDCHSNQTRWPIYDQLPPGSWLAVFDTIRGRQALNFSEWNSRTARRAQESNRQITSGEMPPAAYLLVHPEARLTDAEKQQLIQGLQATR